MYDSEDAFTKGKIVIMKTKGTAQRNYGGSENKSRFKMNRVILYKIEIL